MLWQIIAVLVLLWVCFLRIHKRKYYNLASKLKNGLTSWPIIGHAYLFFGGNENRMTAFIKLGNEALKQGGMVSIWLGHRLFIGNADPEIAEVILKQCLEKDDVVKFFKYVLGNGSIFAPVSIWRPRRKILVPTFNPKNLAQFVHVFAKQSNIMVEQLRSQAGTGPFPLWSYLNTYAMDSVCQSTLGVQLNAQKNPDQPFLKAFDIFCRSMAMRILQPWLHSDFVYKLIPDFKLLREAKLCMSDFVTQIIELKRKEIKEAQNKMLNPNASAKEKQGGYKTFLEMLIESSGGDRGYTDAELQEEILVLVMAGTDTSAVGTAFTAVMLSWYQDVQDKVYEELKDVFGTSKRPVTPEDLPRLKYLDAVIRETLRLYPPAPVTSRKVTKDFTLPSGLTLVSGCGIMTNVWAIHRNPKYWGEDAEVFRPERFLDIEYKHPAQFQAFSYGARNCVGYQYAMMSAKTVLATLLRQYIILPATPPITFNGGRPQYKPLRLKFDVMMKDVDKFMVKLETRK